MISDENVSVIYCILLHFVVNSEKKTKNNLKKKSKHKKELQSFGSFQKVKQTLSIWKWPKQQE